MYGTIARLRIKPGMISRFKALAAEESEAHIPGYMATYLYRMDGNPDEYYMAVLFKDKQSYLANADSPEQDARYQEYRQLLAADPEWHDGEVVYSDGPESK